MYRITDQVLDPSEVSRALAGTANTWSIVIHAAVVVRQTSGQSVTTSVAHTALSGAEEELRQIGSDLRRKWPVQGVAIVRRTGRLAPGEIISIVGIAAEHREDAFGL